jgi:beta-N-acetylhexosaminidase
VADVPEGSADFIYQQHRAFSTNRFKVALDTAAFAAGLEGKGVWPTYKHFPGLGLATKSTDTSVVTITASKATLTNGVFPYQLAIRRHLKPLVMLSTATYPALASSPAAWSPGIIQGFLRQQIGFTGPTITDSLDAAAAVRHRPLTGVTLLSAKAGADFLLITGSEQESAGVYNSLLAAARSGQLSTSDLNASYHRILAFKTHL